MKLFKLVRGISDPFIFIVPVIVSFDPEKPDRALSKHDFPESIVIKN